MKLLQKITYILSLLMATTNFIYTLAFSTNWARGAARLGSFYVDAQEANHLLFRLALFGVVFIGLALVFNTHKNRKFYPANYLFSILSVLMFFTIGVVTLIKIIPLRAAYLLLDPEQLNFVTLLNWSTINTTIFDVGFVFSIIMIICAAFMGYMTWYKFHTHVIRANINHQDLEVNHDNA